MGFSFAETEYKPARVHSEPSFRSSVGTKNRVRGFWESSARTRRENPSQVVELHLESVVFVYDHASGRQSFWSMDTFEGFSSDPLTLHVYLYAWANPVNHDDPSGNFPSLTELTVTAFIGGLVNVAVTATLEPTFLRQPIDELVVDALGEFGKGAAFSLVGGVGSSLATRLLLKTTLRPVIRSILASGIGGGVAGGGSALVNELIEAHINQTPITACDTGIAVVSGTISGFAGGAITYKFNVTKKVKKVFAFPTSAGTQVITVPAEVINWSGVGGVAGAGVGEGVLAEMLHSWLQFMGICD